MKYPVTINGEVQTRTSKYEAKWGVVVWYPYDPKPKLASVRPTRAAAHQSAAYHLRNVAGWEEELTQVVLVPVGGSIDIEPTSRFMVVDESFLLREDGRVIATVKDTGVGYFEGILEIPHLNVKEPCTYSKWWGDFRGKFRSHLDG